MINKKNIFLQMLDVFLDTTPRQWLQKLAVHFQGLGALIHPKTVFNSLVQNYKGMTSIGIYTSLALHGAIVLALGIDLGAVIEENFTEEGRAKVAQQKIIEQEQARQQEKELVEISGIYYMSPEDLFSKKTNKKVKNKKKVSQLNNFLSGLKTNSSNTQSGSNTGSSEGFKVTKVGNVNTDSLKVTKNSKVGNWENELKNIEKGSRLEDIEGELNKHLAKYNTQFRSCYEKALLKDQSLNANIKFLLKVGSHRNISQAKIDFSGSGKPESRKLLNDCLLRITKTIKLPQKSIKLKGKKLKFYVVLNSWK